MRYQKQAVIYENISICYTDGTGGGEEVCFVMKNLSNRDGLYPVGAGLPCAPPIHRPQ